VIGEERRGCCGLNTLYRWSKTACAGASEEAGGELTQPKCRKPAAIARNPRGVSRQPHRTIVLDAKADRARCFWRSWEVWNPSLPAIRIDLRPIIDCQHPLGTFYPMESNPERHRADAVSMWCAPMPLAVAARTLVIGLAIARQSEPASLFPISLLL